VPAELLERDATGEIAAIYAELRRLCGVPYVSSMQRHLATRPGWLPWVWAALRPAFLSGRAQTAAWRAAAGIAVPRLPPVSREALHIWGVEAQAEGRIRAACESFVRVSPVNLVFAGLLRRLLAGERPNLAGGPGAAAATWTPPEPLGELPPMVDPAALGRAERAVLASLGTSMGGQPFVPGLYRMLAGWPGFLAHVATVLGPWLDHPETSRAFVQLVDAVDAEIPAVFASFPALPAETPEPPRADSAGVIAALDTYRITSPQLLVFGRMLRESLPP
jgi:hypothetical protein